MVNYGDSGVRETSFYCCCNGGSSIVIVKFQVFGARRRSLLVYRGDDGVQAVFSIILRSDALALLHAINMNHACRFEEDGEHGFRLETIPSDHCFRVTSLRHPTRVR